MRRRWFDRLSAASFVSGVAFLVFLLGTYKVSEGGGHYWLGWRMDWLEHLSRPLVPGTRVNVALLALLGTGLLPSIWTLASLLYLPGDRVRGRRLAAGLCAACGYDVRASVARCPECGASLASPEPARSPAPPDPSRHALASLAIGIVVTSVGLLVLNLPPRHSSHEEMLVPLALALFIALPGYAMFLGWSGLHAPRTRRACAVAGLTLNAVMIVVAPASSLFFLLGA